MLVDTRRVADRLKLTTSGVRNLVKRGLLHDVGPQNPNAKKHFMKFDSKEITAFAKVYKPRHHMSPEDLKQETLSWNVVPIELQPEPPLQHGNGSVSSRLVRLEEKLDQILYILS
jgi:hypothetical protein